MTRLTDRQLEILEVIRKTVAKRGYPPTVREIGEAVGLSSPSTVHSHLSALVEAGLLRRDPSKPRAIEVVELESARRAEIRDVPLLGRIAAGSPVLASEDVEEIYPLPTSLVGRGPVFMLRVKGDSMLGAGILDGDLAVIRRQPTAEPGEIVAALVAGEEATLKRFYREGRRVILRAENKNYPSMEFGEGVEIIGKLVGLFRSIR